MTRSARMSLLASVCVAAVFAGGAVRRVQDTCGPFSDVSPLYCPYVLEAYYTGISAGTSPTTFSPDVPITRGQAAVFASKGLNQAIARGSRRAALGQWWTITGSLSVTPVSIGGSPGAPVSDGEDVWVPNLAGYVSRVHASDGRVLGTWTGTPNALTAVAAMGRIFVTGSSGEGTGTLYQIDPSLPPGDAAAIATTTAVPFGIAFDGSRIWTANVTGSVSIFAPPNWSETQISTGFTTPRGILYDGSNIWVTDISAGSLLRLDADGAILQTVQLCMDHPSLPVFDGANIWVPALGGPVVCVVRASDGVVLASLSGNGLRSGGSLVAAFDGERVAITTGGATDTVSTASLWRAADLVPLGSVVISSGSPAFGVCSDGIGFWIANTSGSLFRM